MHYLISIRKIRQCQQAPNSNGIALSTLSDGLFHVRKLFMQFFLLPLSLSEKLHANPLGNSSECNVRTYFFFKTDDRFRMRIFHFEFFKVNGSMASVKLFSGNFVHARLQYTDVSALMWFIQIAWWTLWVPRESHINSRDSQACAWRRVKHLITAHWRRGRWLCQGYR